MTINEQTGLAAWLVGRTCVTTGEILRGFVTNPHDCPRPLVKQAMRRLGWHEELTDTGAVAWLPPAAKAVRSDAAPRVDDSWMAPVRSFLTTEIAMVMTESVAQGALGIMRKLDRGDQLRIAAIMKHLGWTSRAEWDPATKKSKRVWRRAGDV